MEIVWEWLITVCRRENNTLNNRYYKSLNEKNVNAADYLPGKIFNKNMIKNVANFYPSTMSDEELNYHKCIFGKKENFKKEITVELVDLIDSKTYRNKNDNSKTRENGATFSPLLFGSSKFSNLNKKHKTFFHKYLGARGISYEDKEEKHVLYLLTQKEKYPKLIDNNIILDEEKQKTNHFKPRHKTDA